MKLLDLFSGIGGFSLAAQWAGIDTVAFVEIDKFCQKVLEKNFNGKVVTDTESEQTQSAKQRGLYTESCGKTPIPIYPDITRFDGTPYRGTVDIISGGFPCQPFSCAGKRRGKEDDRYLWYEMLRVISEVRPSWVIGENVTGIVNMELDNCISDLEGLQYEVQTFIIPACAVNAPHRRDRVWICAHSLNGADRTKRGEVSKEDRIQGINRETLGSRLFAETDCHAPDTCITGLQGCEPEQSLRLSGQFNRSGSNQESNWQENWLEVATRLCRVDDGVSRRVDRLKALGNAIVPQVAYEIFKAIKEADQ